MLAQPDADFVTAELEQRAYDAGRCRANPAQTGRSGSAQEAVENSFGLVVEGVTGRDCAVSLEEFVSQAPGFLLYISFRDKRGGHQKRQIVAGG